MCRGRKVIYRAIGYITFGSFIVMMLQTSMRKKLWYDLLAALLIFIGIFFVTKTFVDDEESDMSKREYERQFDKAAEESSINNDASLVVALIGIVFLLILKLFKII